MTNNKRIGGTRRKKGGGYKAFMSRFNKGVAAVKATAANTASGAMSAVPMAEFNRHVTKVKEAAENLRGKVSEKAGEAHAQMVGHLNTLVGHAEKHFPAAAGHFRTAKTMASMSNFMSSAKSRKFGFGGYGSNKKHSGGAKKKCGLRGGYGSKKKKKPSGGTKKKRGGNKRCGHTKKRGHKRGGTRTRRGGNCKKCGM